ncbi:single-stranded DNA-binding protein [Leptospira kmetyi]|uniref:Single-stranded DNA-binding protein n=1 Tax=Leptospira kmetyi TaxID=408139 RepID=A0ABX4N2R8_9LEPT|nr:hypothetical protein CH378_22205 [Leptospira kmetyi]
MKNLAHIILDGNLTSDPEIKTLGNGKSVATFTLAVNHDYRSTPEDPGDVSFVDIEIWERQAVNAFPVFIPQTKKSYSPTRFFETSLARRFLLRSIKTGNAFTA